MLLPFIVANADAQCMGSSTSVTFDAISNNHENPALCYSPQSNDKLSGARRAARTAGITPDCDSAGDSRVRLNFLLDEAGLGLWWKVVLVSFKTRVKREAHHPRLPEFVEVLPLRCPQPGGARSPETPLFCMHGQSSALGQSRKGPFYEPVFHAVSHTLIMRSRESRTGANRRDFARRFGRTCDL